MYEAVHAHPDGDATVSRFARTAALEQTGRAFVKTLRAKGTDRLRLGRHVLRNASL